MNPGKACAQAAHVGNAFETHLEIAIRTASISTDENERSRAETLNKALHEWKTETSQGFGTTIVLGGSMTKIKNDVEWLKKNGFLANVVHDPTYPLRDGSVTHLIALDTCGYVFAPDKDNSYLRVILDTYELHR
jgi:hypothetical protein